MTMRRRLLLAYTEPSIPFGAAVVFAFHRDWVCVAAALLIVVIFTLARPRIAPRRRVYVIDLMRPDDRAK